MKVLQLVIASLLFCLSLPLLASPSKKCKNFFSGEERDQRALSGIKTDKNPLESAVLNKNVEFIKNLFENQKERKKYKLEQYIQTLYLAQEKNDGSYESFAIIVYLDLIVKGVKKIDGNNRLKIAKNSFLGTWGSLAIVGWTAYILLNYENVGEILLELWTELP